MKYIKYNNLMSFVLFSIFIYAIFMFVQQQSKINSYNRDIVYYSTKVEELNSKKEELLATEKNVNSEDYIEEVARKSLEMYLPTEIVYIDVSK